MAKQIMKSVIVVSANVYSSPDATPKKKQAFSSMRLIQEPIVPEAVYSATEVSELLNMSRRQVLYFSITKYNTSPIHKSPNETKDSFVLRNELIVWLKICPLAEQNESTKSSKWSARAIKANNAICKLFKLLARAINLVYVLTKLFIIFSKANLLP